MRVIVTRPGPQAVDWVARLRAAGIDAVALPLIAIAPPPDPAAVAAAWARLAERRLVVFVSPNAAQQFFAAQPRGASWPTPVGAASPGPGTTRMLVELGVPAQQITDPAADSLQFDSESLWSQLGGRDWNGASVLLVRGESGRDWLAERLRGRGARVDVLAAYRRVAAPLDAAQRALLDAAIAAPRNHFWLFSSSEALDQLAQLSPDGDTGRWAAARALATHPRIAARAQQFGFGAVVTVRPAWDALVGCIQSLGP